MVVQLKQTDFHEQELLTEVLGQNRAPAVRHIITPKNKFKLRHRADAPEVVLSRNNAIQPRINTDGHRYRRGERPGEQTRPSSPIGKPRVIPKTHFHPCVIGVQPWFRYFFRAWIRLRAGLKIARGAAARDFGCGQGGEGASARSPASPQWAVRAEPTPPTDKRPAAPRVFALKAVWLRCSSVADP